MINPRFQSIVASRPHERRPFGLLLRQLSFAALLALLCLDVSAANRTWDGGDLDLPGLWSARTNWNGNSNIVAGDALFFPGTATVKTMNNNLSISNFAKLTFNDDGYTLSGNSLRLTNGITVNYVPTGPTRINAGIQLGDDAAFEADDSSATLELNGPVNLLGFVLTNQGVGNITWLAPFSSSAGGILRKLETGTVTVRSTNVNFLGTVEISGGDFNVNGRMTAGAISVLNNGTLGGTGLVHAVSVNSGGIIAPGGAARGVLTVTNGLTLRARSIYDCDVLGAGAGQFDQLNVLGTVILTNASLNVAVNFVPAGATAITLIANDGADPVLGTFSGMPEGGVVLVTDFIRATISYTGGTGNDVVITVSPLDTLTWTGSANGLWSVGANWVGGVAPQPGDSLVFPVVAVRKLATNDFPADTVFGLMRYETNYFLTGERAALRRGFHASHNSVGAGALHLPLRLAATQTFTNQFQDLRYFRGIELGGFGLTFRSGSAGVEHMVDSTISGSGTVTEAGVGQLFLTQSNSFTGVLVVQDSVQLGHPDALGSPAQGAIVEGGGRLSLTSLPAEAEIADPLNLAGTLFVGTTNTTWSGNVTFEHPQAGIQVFTNQTFTLSGATLGTNGFIKQDDGTLRLATIQASHGGTTVVNQGTLQVDTAMTNSVLVVSNGATLSGSGLVRQAGILSGGVLSPGPGAGLLTVTQSLVMQGAAVFRVELNGPVAGVGHDQVNVQGTVSLGAGTAALDVQLGFSPTNGQSFTILRNDLLDGINGSFAGWPDGAIVAVDGVLFQIDYQGGTGNDIVLTKQPETRTWTGLGANNNWTTPQNWAGNLAPEPGDILVFPPTAARRTNVNDFAAGTPIRSLDVRGSYHLSGAEIGLRAGLTAVVTDLPGADIHLPLTLLANQTFALSNTLIYGVTFGGELNLGAFSLTMDVRGPQFALVDGPIAGAGALIKTGAGQLDLLSTNSYSGLTLVEEGKLFFRRDQTLGQAGAGTVVFNGATLVFNDAFVNETVTEPLVLAGDLALNPNFNLIWNAPVTIQNDASVIFTEVGRTNVTTFPAGIAGSGTLRFASTTVGVPVTHLIPELRLPASNGFSGTVTVEGLQLEVNGSLPNASLALRTNLTGPTTFTGTGLVRGLTVGPGCVLSPAGTNGGDGTISTLTVTQSLVLEASSVYRVNLNGLTVQSYDQLDVLGTVNLGPGVATLDVQRGFTPPEGHTFVILDNDGTDAIVGTFAGLSQGAVFTVGDVRLEISYTGGTGNDVALTVLGPEELTWNGSVSGHWGTAGNWSPARSPKDGDRLVFPGGTPRTLVTNNIATLELHSLRFARAGVSNNHFQLHGASPSVSSGIVVSNPVSAEFLDQVVLTAPQTLVTRGPLSFSGVLNASQGVTVAGNSTFRVKEARGGVYQGIGGTWELTGEYAALSLGLSNVFLNYAAVQSSSFPARLTNSTFRLDATNAVIEDLQLVDSVLDVASFTGSGPSSRLVINQDLKFLGASRLVFGYDAVRRPVIEAVTGLSLNDATLVLSNITVAFNQPITLIELRTFARVDGTFAGLPEGAEVIAPNGTRLVISYEGGNGNDVTLTAVAPITGVTRFWDGGGSRNLWSEAANWSNNIVPSTGDSIVFRTVSKAVNTNNLPQNRVNQLSFISPTPVARELRFTNTFGSLQLLGGLDFRETGTLRIPFTNSGIFNFSGWVDAQGSQAFFVTNGGRVTVDVLTGALGAVVTKTGDGTLELGHAGSFSSSPVGMTFRQEAGVLRLGETTEPVEQRGGTLEVLEAAREVTLLGGDFQTAPGTTNGGVRVGTLTTAPGPGAILVRPGGEGAVGLITVTNGVTLRPNATLRVDVSGAPGGPGFSLATNDLFDLDDTGEFRPNDARLELSFLPAFQPSPTNRLFITLSQNSRTNIGTFAGLPQLGVLTNELGHFRIYYRDFAPPPPLDIFFGGGVTHESVILERIAARPALISVTNGPGSFKTVTGLGTPGTLYVIEGSEDLENWDALSGETANALTGRFSFTDVTGLPHRFYRARLP